VAARAEAVAARAEAARLRSELAAARALTGVVLCVDPRAGLQASAGALAGGAESAWRRVPGPGFLAPGPAKEHRVLEDVPSAPAKRHKSALSAHSSAIRMGE
jgi:hypothetical protein